MPIYVSTACLVNSNNIFEILETYIKAGLKNIELGSVHSYIGRISPARLKQYGLNFICHHYFPPPEKPIVINLASTDPMILNRSKKQLKKSIEFCHQAGINLFSFHAGFRVDPTIDFNFPKDKPVTPYKIAFDIFVDAIIEIDDYARERGIRIAIENNVLSDYNVVNGENPFLLLCEAAEFEELWTRVPSTNVGILLDMGHLKVTSHWLKFDRYEFIERVKDRVFAIHLHENDGQCDSHLPLYETSWCFDLINKKCFQNLPITIESNKMTISQIVYQVSLAEMILGSDIELLGEEY